MNPDGQAPIVRGRRRSTVARIGSLTAIVSLVLPIASGVTLAAGSRPDHYAFAEAIQAGSSITFRDMSGTRILSDHGLFAISYLLDTKADQAVPKRAGSVAAGSEPPPRTAAAI